MKRGKNRCGNSQTLSRLLFFRICFRIWNLMRSVLWFNPTGSWDSGGFGSLLDQDYRIGDLTKISTLQKHGFLGILYLTQYCKNSILWAPFSVWVPALLRLPLGRLHKSLAKSIHGAPKGTWQLSSPEHINKLQPMRLYKSVHSSVMYNSRAFLI